MEKTSRTKILKKPLLFTLAVIFALILNTIAVGTVYSTPEQPTIPSVTVTPDPYIATHVGEEVNINVNIERVDSELQLIGVQARLRFNTTILEVLNVSQGNFFKDWIEIAGLDPNATNIYFWWLQEDDYVISFTIIADLTTPPTVFPEGSGTLATITFNATSGPPAYCKLDLYDVMLIDFDLATISHTVKDGYYKCLDPLAPEDVPPLQVEVVSGTIHFRGEIVQFYILTTYKGVAVNASLYSLLYKPDGTIETLTPTWIAQGFYEIGYEIAVDASTGTYTLLVEADYNVTAETGIQTTGTSLEAFQVSATLGQIMANLTAIDAKLIAINENVATINSTVGSIQISVDAIHLKVVEIDWETKIAVIQTSLGTIEGYVEDIDDGGLATINTELGTVKTNISDIEEAQGDIEEAQGTLTTLQYTVLVLALIAAIGAILCAFLLSKK